jgi:hypothetical protein
MAHVSGGLVLVPILVSVTAAVTALAQPLGGPEVEVGTASAGAPETALDAAGRFVVTWTAADGDQEGVLARRFDASSVPQGSPFQVNTHTSGAQRAPVVAADPAGDVLFVWEGRGPSDPHGVFARRYDAAGAALGAEFRVNTTGGYSVHDPAVAADGAGGLRRRVGGLGRLRSRHLRSTIRLGGPPRRR